jgi:hypothetical protein
VHPKSDYDDRPPPIARPTRRSSRPSPFVVGGSGTKQSTRREGRHRSPSATHRLRRGQGEAKDYIADGAIEIGGRLPINTHGGQLGEAYIHGMNGIAEGVRQLRGTSVNQVPDVEHVLITAGTGVPTSGLILG